MRRFLPKKHFLFSMVGCFVSLQGPVWADDSASLVDFNREIRPILADCCFECHGPDEHGRKGDLRLDLEAEAHASAILPGNAADSLFVERLLSHDEDEVMPPPESSRQPTEQQIQKLIRWIDQGANYDEHWSFVPVKRPQPPTVSDPDWTRNAIDHFVLARLDEKSLTKQTDARPGILARRLALTLTGLPATPQEIADFEKAWQIDQDSTVADWTDELLARSSYGEHFAWNWLDAGRYADTNGYQSDGPRTMWRWRDWLIEQLNGNVPYDELTEKMLAGDLLIERDWETGDWIPDQSETDLLLATGFLRNHRYDTGSGTIPEESKFENAADRLETVGTVWMGLTMQCARCHTHKFDPIEQREYYEMLDFFDNVPEIGTALKGASHPYIHTPTEVQREELLRLKREAEEAESSFENAVIGLADQQTKWEATASTAPRVTRGMQHRFAAETVTFDGRRSLEKSNHPMKLIVGDRAWAISFWFRSESEKNSAIFSSVEDPDGYRPGLQVDWIDGHLRLRHVSKWINSHIEMKSLEKLVPGQWYHVTFRSDGRVQGPAYRASINGSDDAMVCTHPNINDKSDKPGEAPLVLGGSPLLPSFVGQIRDLRFYDRDISAVELASLADSRTTAELTKLPGEKRSQSVASILLHTFIESDAVSPKIAELRDRVFSSRAALHEAIKSTPTTMVMKEVDRGPTHIRATGVYDSATDPVRPAVPAFLHEMTEDYPDRHDFARWLTEPENPLTARVAVNRIWQQLWGLGFVDSPENFGIQCAEPVHSDLLDWLASEYVRLGWDTKALIKLIVTSRAWRQESAAPTDLWEEDPQNRLLARGPRYRLPIQTVRDQALALGGRLDNTMGGAPVILDPILGKDEKPQTLGMEQSQRRRTLYSFWKRNGAHPMLAVFDVADRNQCDVRTRRTNTPLQALVTLNEASLVDSARDFAKRARREGGEIEADQLHWAWVACTGRPPSEREAKRLAWTLEQYRTAADDEDTAWTALANVLLNLDATLSVE